MAKPTDTVPPWATAGNYPPSVYGPLVPETKPNPLALLPTPWSGLPRTEAGTLVAFAAQGLSPQIPSAAQEFNEWLARVGKWANWVEEGSSAADANAHPMETDASGFSNAVQYDAATGYLSNGAAALLPSGATASGIVNALAGINLADQTLAGGVGSLADVETVLALGVEYDDAGLTLPPNIRQTRFNETTLTVHDSDGQVRSISVPDYGYEVAFSTGNPIDLTGAACGRRLQETEKVWLRLTFDYNHTTGAVGTLSTRIRVNGPGVVDINLRTYDLAAAAGVRWKSLSQIFPWTPTDDFVLPGTTAYSMTAMVGSNLGNTLETRNIGIEIVSAVEA